MSFQARSSPEAAEDQEAAGEYNSQSYNELTEKASEDNGNQIHDGGRGPDNNESQDYDSDKHTVWWDGVNDPSNPYNWPAWKKLINGVLISALAFVTPLASSFFAPGVPQLMKDYNSSNNLLASFVVSVYVLGFAFGPLIMAPMSEIYGRSIIYNISNVCFVVFMVACALAPSLQSLIVFRFFSGVFGSCPLANASGSILDMVTQEKRATAMAAITIGPLLGPIIGPIAGGFLSAAKGWRWVFWVLAIVSGALTILMLAFLRESYAPVLLRRKTNRLQKETGDYSFRSKLDDGLTPQARFKRAIVRPMKMLFTSPLVFVFAIYSAVVYGYLYLLFTSVTEVFEDKYGFSTSIVGLVYLGPGVGMMLGLAFYSSLSDRAVKAAIASQEGRKSAKPELRLALLPVGAVILPSGFFIYGWTAQNHIHWIVPILGLGLIGIGTLIAFMAVNMYLVDAFMLYAASALAAVTVIRSIGGALVPLGALDMYAALGLGWGNSLLGFIAVALIPLPLIILRYGEGLRERFKIN